MPALETFAFLALALLGWFWLDSLRARDAAVTAAREACAAEGLMLLDDTVAIARVGTARDEDGRLRVKRVYDFEYSDSGNNRLGGRLVLVGRAVVMLKVGVRHDRTLLS